MKAAVIGLGKIGLPLAVQIARSGVPTIGADISTRVVEAVNAGEPPFPGEEGLAESLTEVTASGALTATTSTPEAVGSANVTLVVVPLIVDGAGTPDFGAMDAATRDIASALRPGHLVSYETTLPVGTARQRFTPMLRAGTTLVPGVDFHVVHSPERVFSGRVFRDLRSYPKLVGGLTAECARKGVDFYERVLEFDDRPDLERSNGVWNLGSLESAELAKLVETTYRDVNIALANEFARYCEHAGLDVHDVIRAANSQPYSHVHRPGVAVGGHCIPVYPQFYLQGDPHAVLPAAARRINTGMPRHVVDRLEAALGSLEDSEVVILGAAYRGGVKETAFSGVFPLNDLLTEKGAEVFVHDPLYSESELQRLGLAPYRSGQKADAAIVHSDHVEYRTLRREDIPGLRIIVDGRNILDHDLWAPVPVLSIGRG